MSYKKKNNEVWPYFNQQQADLVKKVLISNKVNYWTGKEGIKFEKEFKSFIGAKYAIAVSNASMGLECALKSLKIKKGDHVIVTPKSFITSVSSIINLEAIPIFVDIDINSQNINANAILKKITNKTKAILCVHLGGFPCDMVEIVKISKKFNIKIIEDCSQSLGGKINNKHLGTFGNVSVWSFCNDKIISTGGEGGMICTDSKVLWNKIWSLKDTGKNFDKVYNYKHKFGFKWLNHTFGTNLRLTEMQSALGRYQLSQINKYHKKRKNNAYKIMQTCKKFKSLIVPIIPLKYEHAFYRCYISVNKKYLLNNWNRDKIIKFLNKKNIECNVGSCSEIYLEKSFKDKPYKPKKRLINAKLSSKNSIAFFVHHNLSKEYIQYTCKEINKLLNRISV